LNRISVSDCVFTDDDLIVQFVVYVTNRLKAIQDDAVKFVL